MRKEGGGGRACVCVCVWGGGGRGDGVCVTGQVFEWQCLSCQWYMASGPVVNDYYHQILLRLLATPGQWVLAEGP